MPLDSTEVSAVVPASPDEIWSLWMYSQGGVRHRAIIAWRTSDCAPTDVDSLVFLSVEVVPAGARVRIEHAQIPEGQGERHRQGWDEFYLQPLHRHLTSPKRPAAKAKPAAKIDSARSVARRARLIARGREARLPRRAHP